MKAGFLFFVVGLFERFLHAELMWFCHTELVWFCHAELVWFCHAELILASL